MNIKLLPLIIFFCMTHQLMGQESGFTIKGKVLDNATEQPIEFATVVVSDKETREAIAGITTNMKGEFVVESSTSNVLLEVSFIGFESLTISDYVISNSIIDFGTILLSEISELLEEVTVRAEKSQTEFKLDKRVFNVGKDLSSTGASVLEVLNNVPSVNVNIEGEISLRGSTGVQILLNGKPSILASDQSNALGTITAEMLDRIEVITNPSAKYDAEGTSGIINIVIKKEEREGANGSVSLNAGLPHNHSFGFSLNRRTEKFNLFSQLGLGYRELPRHNENINQDLTTNTSIFSSGTEYRNEMFYNLILGTDYHINPLNVITLSGHFTYEVEDQPSETNFEFFDETNTLDSEWIRSEVTEATNPKWRYELQYKKEFKDSEDHSLLFSALGNFFGKDQSSEFDNMVITGDNGQFDQRTNTEFNEAKYTFNLDYTKPFSDKVSIETGGQFVLQDVNNDYSVSNLIDDEWVPDAGLTNDFEYTQNVMAFYGTSAYENDKWGLKLGLRMENTDLSTFLVNTTEANEQNYTDFFPTAHSSYKITKQLSLQAGYSRRIYRPRLWDLNPFFNIRNNFSVRVGNPELQAEYTDSYELSSIFVEGKTSLNLSVYHRYTTDVIERISSFEDNINTFRPENIGTNRSTGIEFNAKYTANKWLTINGDFNYSYFTREGMLNEAIFDFSADQWTTKWTGKMKLPSQIDFEMTGHYHSSRETLQSEISDHFHLDLGIRKKILKGKAVLNISVRDVFSSRQHESETFQSEYYLYNKSDRGRFATVGFSYGFGKGEAMEYSGRRRR